MEKLNYSLSSEIERLIDLSNKDIVNAEKNLKKLKDERTELQFLYKKITGKTVLRMINRKIQQINWEEIFGRLKDKFNKKDIRKELEKLNHIYNEGNIRYFLYSSKFRSRIKILDNGSYVKIKGIFKKTKKIIKFRKKI